MKPLDERLNEHLDLLVLKTRRNGHQAGGFTKLVPAREHSWELEELVTLAQHLRSAPQVQVTPDFTRQLERRLRRRYAERHLQQGSRRRSPLALLRARPLLGTVLGLCVLVCLLSTGVLALAAQVSDPGNPLYAIRRWEQQVQVQFSGNAADQAVLDLQFARDRLNTLSGLADPSHAGAYRQGLLDLDRQLAAARSAIKSLPAGSQHERLAGELAGLQSDAIRVLRGLLPRLALPECLATTEELGQLGDTVPMLTRAAVILSTHSNGRATISLQGSDLQVGAHLLVDDAVVEASGTYSPGQVVFVAPWPGDQHPQSLGILNPDGTVAQTTTITITGATNGNQNVNDNKPTSTPTPHGNKPPVTPTPHGNRPPVTPTPHD